MVRATARYLTRSCPFLSGLTTHPHCLWEPRRIPRGGGRGGGGRVVSAAISLCGLPLGLEAVSVYRGLGRKGGSEWHDSPAPAVCTTSPGRCTTSPGRPGLTCSHGGDREVRGVLSVTDRGGGGGGACAHARTNGSHGRPANAGCPSCRTKGGGGAIRHRRERRQSKPQLPPPRQLPSHGTPPTAELQDSLRQEQTATGAADAPECLMEFLMGSCSARGQSKLTKGLQHGSKLYFFLRAYGGRGRVTVACEGLPP